MWTTFLNNFKCPRCYTEHELPDTGPNPGGRFIVNCNCQYAFTLESEAHPDGHLFWTLTRELSPANREHQEPPSNHRDGARFLVDFFGYPPDTPAETGRFLSIRVSEGYPGFLEGVTIQGSTLYWNCPCVIFEL